MANSKLFEDLSRSEIHLQYKGDFDKQFQFLTNAVIRMEEIFYAERDLLIERIDELEAKLNSFVPSPDSDSIKPDVSGEPEVEEIIEEAEPEVEEIIEEAKPEVVEEVEEAKPEVVEEVEEAKPEVEDKE